MNLLRRLRYLTRHRQRDRDLAEELEFHRALTQDPRQMGNLTRSREDARAVWIWPWLQSVWQDATYALRSLRRQPAFTIVALLTLGMAIGFVRRQPVRRVGLLVRGVVFAAAALAASYDPARRASRIDDPSSALRYQ